MLFGNRQTTSRTEAPLTDKRTRIITITLALHAAVLLASVCGVAWSHAGERGFVLLLPTRLFIIGGTLAVVASFVIAFLLSRRVPDDVARTLALQDGAAPAPRGWPGLVSLAVLAVLVTAGFTGSRDPLANPLPLAVWSGWWIGFTVLQALFGNLWSWINPWPALYWISDRLLGRISKRDDGRVLVYPRWLGYGPAVLFLLAFAWLELVYPSPQDPERLAWAVLGYAAVTLAGMHLFGPACWLGRAEAFTVFFTMVSWLSPFGFADRPRSRSTWPGGRLLRVGPVPVSGVCFVLVALAAVSFDGLSRTFWWLALVGQNPLEFPGRSALVAVNTLGLLAMFTVFFCAYGLVVLGSRGLGGERVPAAFRRLVVSIIPIAFGYHFAHYLPAFLVDVQYLAVALSDPLALGWDLFGTAGVHVKTSFLMHHRSVELIWYVQVSTIVLAHVCAVAVAHLITLRALGVGRRALTSQLPATVLMVFYTAFGLWLLSTPVAA